MDKILSKIKAFIPKNIFKRLRPIYHYSLAFLGNLIYNSPSKEIFVIGITGTKGKSTTAEILSSILEEAGYKTALASTVRFKIGEESKPNMLKMTMPGRFFLQKFLREAVIAKCDYAIIEMSSEGAKNFRHKFIELNSLIFTNISPEHIDSHGSYKRYLLAKLEIAKQLEISKKPSKSIIVNGDDKESDKFLNIDIPNKIIFSLSEAKPFTLEKDYSDINILGERLATKLPGEFNIYNILAAASFARSQGISPAIIKNGIEKITMIPGRVERIEINLDDIRDSNGNKIGFGVYPNFTVVVDYAHTADSLEKLYKVFRNDRKICVLGSCGGGRDKWKRPKMGGIAEKYCDEIILTNEDPYDEPAEEIILSVAKGIKNKTPRIIIDRREAIKEALLSAKIGDAVLITGKGTDPYMMLKNGEKIPWSDKRVAEEELAKLAIERAENKIT